MTHQAIAEIQKANQATLKSVEKSIFTSKKFIAFLLTGAAQVVMLLAVINAIKAQPSIAWALSTLGLALALSFCFCALAFNVSQAKLDSAVRGMAMIAPTDIRDKLKKALSDSK
jgi:hypothetical protein